MKRNLGTMVALIGLLLLAAACTATATPPEPTAVIAADSDAGTAAATVAAGPTERPTATAIPPTATPSPTAALLVPSIVVADQAIGDGTVIIDTAISRDSSWLVIHRDEGGSPGVAIGFAPLRHGENDSVRVEIDPAQATPTLYAMIHIDDGTPGDFEFPYYDPPAEVDGREVVEAFAVSGLAQVTETPPPSDRVQVSIDGFQFSPGDVTVQVGTTVVWTNLGDRSHTVTADDGSFNSGTLSGGDTFEFTFTTAGTYAYYCRFHGGPGHEGMSGTITVTN